MLKVDCKRAKSTKTRSPSADKTAAVTRSRRNKYFMSVRSSLKPQQSKSHSNLH